jgi:hypothetical protein
MKQKEPIGNSKQLTEQKEPCDFCKHIYTIEATSYTYTEPIASLSGLNEINYCPKCGRPLNAVEYGIDRIE